MKTVDFSFVFNESPAPIFGAGFHFKNSKKEEEFSLKELRYLIECDTISVEHETGKK